MLSDMTGSASGLVIAFDWLLAFVVVIFALYFRALQLLCVPGLAAPIAAMFFVMSGSWIIGRLLPAAMPVHLSGACLAVLMFGWPLGVLLSIIAGAVGVAMTGFTGQEGLVRIVWQAVMPATFALAIAGALRRWAPSHVFVYILGRAFIGTAIATSVAGWLGLVMHAGVGLTQSDLVAQWLMAWGEAFLTGMFAAIFVALRPSWLVTYSDQRYLPR